MIRRVGKRGKKLYKGYPKKRKKIIERAGSKCEVVISGERCGKHGAMVDHITPRGMAGANSQWLNDERNLMVLCLDHSEMGRYRTYRAEKYRSLQTLYPGYLWGMEGPWREFLTEQNDEK